MAQLICPTCGKASDGNYCTTCMSVIPVSEPENLDENSLSGSQFDESAGAEIPHEFNCFNDEPEDKFRQTEPKMKCPNCGMPGVPKKECSQCGEMIPDTPPETQHERSGSRATNLSFPSGQRIELENGKEYAIGRESDNCEIACALGDSQYVSRRHCTIRVNNEKRIVEIRDEGSTNGTFVGSERRRVYGSEPCSLPTDVWLGSHTVLTID